MAFPKTEKGIIKSTLQNIAGFLKVFYINVSDLLFIPGPIYFLQSKWIGDFFIFMVGIHFFPIPKNHQARPISIIRKPITQPILLSNTAHTLDLLSLSADVDDSRLSICACVATCLLEVSCFSSLRSRSIFLCSVSVPLRHFQNLEILQGILFLFDYFNICFSLFEHYLLRSSPSQHGALFYDHFFLYLS